MRLGVLSVVHPASSPFLDDFLRGLESQTDRAFQTILLNDGVTDLERRVAGLGLPITIRPAAGTPAAIRKSAIRHAAELGIDIVVFLDSDDYCDSHRISRTRQAATKGDILFCELLLFGGGLDTPRPMLEKRRRNGELAIGLLRDANFLGLSNTAAPVATLLPVLEKLPDDLIAFDWALFARVLANGSGLRFLAGTSTWYRQHGDNASGLLDLSDDRIRRAVRIKARHYAVVADLGPDYREAMNSFAALDARLDADQTFHHMYCDAVRSQAPADPLWWEPVKRPEALGL